MTHYATRGAVIDRLLTEHPGVRILRVVVDNGNNDRIEILTEHRIDGATYKEGEALGVYRASFDMDGITIDALHVDLDEYEAAS